MNEHFIKPLTLRAGGMSYALMRNPDGLECDVFVTHAWAEGCFEFCEKVRAACPPNARGIWICFLANPQSPAGARGPFRKGICGPSALLSGS